MNRNFNISIVTVCKNEEQTIERTIQSIIRQSYPFLDYVIIDGQSTDDTPNIIKKYAQHCRFFSAPDDGIYDAMNRGLAAAAGEYVLFINAGDYLIHDGVIEKCVRLISTASSPADVFFGNIFLYNEANGSGWLWRPMRRTRLTMFMECLPHPATFFSRRAFEKNGLFDPTFKIAGDFEWFVRGMEKNNISYRYMDTVVTLFNEDGVSITASYQSLHKLERRRILEMHYTKKARAFFRVGVFFRKNVKFFDRLSIKRVMQQYWKNNGFI